MYFLIIFFYADVCFLRLDFETFTIEGVADTLELQGAPCATDTFVVSTVRKLK